METEDRSQSIQIHLRSSRPRAYCSRCHPSQRSLTPGSRYERLSSRPFLQSTTAGVWKDFICLLRSSSAFRIFRYVGVLGFAFLPHSSQRRSLDGQARQPTSAGVLAPRKHDKSYTHFLYRLRSICVLAFMSDRSKRSLRGHILSTLFCMVEVYV
jgi:hypothetical protein